MNKIAVVVLFWNDSKKTINCLNSLVNQKKISFDIVLVDNNSEKKFSNQIFNWIKKKKIELNKVSYKKIFLHSKNKKKIFYIKNKSNFGCGLGHNYGYRFCLNNKYDYIARIDNDMIAPKSLIHALINRLENEKKIGAVSPKVMFEHDRKIIWFGGTKIGNNLKLQKECSNHICKKPDNINFRGLIKTDAIVGCASIMRSEGLKKAGLSDPDFFYGEEDIELSYRLKNLGYELYVDLDQKIYHSVSHTVGVNWAKNTYYNYKYRLVLIKKIGSKLDKLIGYSMFIIKFIIMILLSFRKKYSSRIIQVYLAGLHYLQNKYGHYDRKNYKLINNFFIRITKNSSLLDILNVINKNNLNIFTLK